MDSQKHEGKKGVVLSVVAVLALIALVFGVTYAIFTYTGAGTKENTFSSGTITFTYAESTNGISITNAHPIADETGKVLAATGDSGNITQGYFDFTVSAAVAGTASINYEVYATDISSETNKLDPSYVKVYLTDGAATETAMSGYTGTVPTYNTLTTATSDIAGKQLYTGTFNATGTQKFRLRIWVANTYVVTGTVNTFKLKVNVKATA